MNLRALFGTLLLTATLVAFAPPASATSLSCTDSSALMVAGAAVLLDDANGDGAVDCHLFVTCPAASATSCSYSLLASTSGTGLMTAAVVPDALKPLGQYCIPLTPTVSGTGCSQHVAILLAPGASYGATCSASALPVTTAKDVVLTCTLVDA